MAQEGAQVKNAADTDQVKKARERDKSEAEIERNDLLWVLADARGRRFLWRLLAFCGVFKTSFTGNSTTFFNEGQRNVGLKYTNDIMDARPEAYIEMINEAKKKTLNEETPKKDNNNG